MEQEARQGLLTLEHTILSYDGEERFLRLPEQVEGSPMTRIGDGALAESRALQRLWIPSSVRQVGRSAVARCGLLELVFLEGQVPDFDQEAFFDCPRLRQIRIKDLPVTEEQYKQLLEDSMVNPGGQRFPEHFPKIPGLEKLADALDVERAAHIPRDAQLLLWQEAGRDPKALSSYEQEKLLELIRSGRQPRPDWESEEKNDEALRRYRQQRPQRVCFFGFEKGEAPVKDGMRLLDAFLHIGCWFWQGTVELLWDGQPYYLYQRHYLHSMASMQYIRRDHGLFTADGPVRDERLAKEIYAKYKLLSIL